ncbi:MAG: SDR family NAD(P)-dependent oxidoreductase [Thermoleophilia bacterium]|nr:SDR family NAD(P)-dependent oxidoreductase [Thermoleophilia bacterium]
MSHWALVTGACSGIGREIAKELAHRGYSLVLVSHRGESLREVAEQISAQFGVESVPITMDLAQPDAASSLYRTVRDMDIEVEVLVSNAGIFFFGEVADTDPQAANAMLQLHVVTPSLLALFFGRDMRTRRRGHILFVSSVSAWRDFPGIALYGSSKRYLRSFAMSLREELRPYGVNVTCLAPGATATSLYDQTSVPVAKAVKYGVMKHPAEVARAGVRGMFKRKGVVIPTFSAKVTALIMSLMPRWLIRLIRNRSPFLPPAR